MSWKATARRQVKRKSHLSFRPPGSAMDSYFTLCGLSPDYEHRSYGQAWGSLNDT